MTDYAKIGYEAYRAASGGTTFDGRAMPTWEELEQLPHGERTRRLWGEAARAIAKYEPTPEQALHDPLLAALARMGATAADVIDHMRRRHVEVSSQLRRLLEMKVPTRFVVLAPVQHEEPPPSTVPPSGEGAVGR
ncbi:hypothetical protein WMF30_40245 [Sorangium sp. So ce134]